VLVGDRPGRYPVPPIRLSAFDPDAAEYRRLTTAPLTLEIVPATGDAPVIAAAEPAGGGGAAPQGGRWFGSGSLRSVLRGGLLLAMLTALGIAVARLRERPDSPAGRLRRRLDATRSIASPREAAQALDETWRAHLETRFGLARAMPLTQWRSHLAAQGVAPDAVDELAALFEDLHLLAFAPELADAEALREALHRRSRGLARRLR
jgi:hypothetical protein